MEAKKEVGVSGKYQFVQAVLPTQLYRSGKRNFSKYFGELTDADVEKEMEAGSKDFVKKASGRRLSDEK